MGEWYQNVQILTAVQDSINFYISMDIYKGDMELG